MNANDNFTKQLDYFKLISQHRKELMGLAAIWIFFFHTQFFRPVFNNAGFVFTCLFIKNIGYCGVDIFLFLSGMGLVNSINKNSLSTFYTNRFKRLVIPYILITIIASIVNNWSFLTFIKELTYYNMLAKDIYDFLWFFPLITILYLLFPLYFYFFKRFFNKIIFTVFSLALWFTVSLLIRNFLREDLWGFINRIPIFILGILFGYVASKKPFNVTPLTIFAFFMIMLLGLFFAFVTYYNLMDFIVPGASCYLANLLIAVSFPFLVSLICEINSRIKFLKPITSVLSFLGGISLELYAVQETIMYKTRDFFVSHQEIAFRGIATFLLVVVAAYVLHLITQYILMLFDYLILHFKNHSNNT